MASPGPVTPAETIPVGPWPKGMNNRASAEEVPDGALRLVFNGDITNKGAVRRRLGYTVFHEAARTHSVFGAGSVFLFVQDAQLYRGLPPNHLVIRSNVGHARMAYHELNDEVYYSNGSVTGKIDENGMLRPWGIPQPTPPVLSNIPGSLPEGRYQVSLTHIDDRGEEGGAPVSVVIDVPVGGGGIEITFNTGTVDPTITSMAVYVSKTNDDTLYRLVTLPIATVAYNVLSSVTGNRILQTQRLQPMPPVTQIEYYNGILYGVDGRTIWHTRPLRYGLVDLAKDFILAGADISVFKTTADGFYVCAEVTWWYGGSGPGSFQPRVVLPFGAVPGTGVNIGTSRDVAWFSKNGWIIGKPGGAAEQITDPAVAVKGYASGVSLFREQNGIRQLVSALRGGADNSFEAFDFDNVDEVRSEGP